MNPDGSSLIGALNPSSVGQALKVDAQGYLMIDIGAGSSSGTQYTDGAAAPAHPVGTAIAFNNAGTINTVSNSNPLPITGSISASNPSVGTDGSATPTSSTLIGGSDGTNLQGALVESASHPNLRTAIYNAGNEMAVDGSGRITLVPNQPVKIVDTAGSNQLAIDASGRLTLVPNSSVNVNQIGGQPPTLDNTSVLAVSMRGKNAAAGDTALLLDASGRPQNNIAQIAGVAPGMDNTNELRVSLYGKNAAAGDTSVLTDSSGRLQTANYIGGSAVSHDNPYPSADQIRLWIANGQGFSATTGKQTAAGAINAGFSIFNPYNSGKTIIVYSILLMVGAISFNQLNIISNAADPALGTSATAVNRNANSATTSVASVSYSNTTLTITGNLSAMIGSATNTPMQFLQDGDVIYIPAKGGGGPNSNGVVIYPILSSGVSWFVSAEWVEV